MIFSFPSRGEGALCRIRKRHYYTKHDDELCLNYLWECVKTQKTVLVLETKTVVWTQDPAAMLALLDSGQLVFWQVDFTVGYSSLTTGSIRRILLSRELVGGLRLAQVQTRPKQLTGPLPRYVFKEICVSITPLLNFLTHFVSENILNV